MDSITYKLISSHPRYDVTLMQKTASSWGSRLGFILASAGSAVGLGAIWKFPYMAGTNGGSAFMLPYILFTFTVGIAMLISEYAIGRAGRAGAVGSLRAVAGRGWGFFGIVGVITSFTILCFYSCVGGWCLKYLVDALMGEGLINNAAELNAHFGNFVSDGVKSYAYQLVFLITNCLVVMGGVQEGIERLAKVLMPTLFVLMLVLIIRGLMLPGAWEGVAYLFTPRFEDLTTESLFNAMGFTFFSLSLGAATMVTYAGYLSEKANLATSTTWVAFLAILSALLGGLMVMPTVFAFGLDPAAGPGLTFVTMPAIFSQMPFGQFFAILFYLCLVVAAITSSVSMLEAFTATMLKATTLPRRSIAIAGTLIASIIGLFCTLSFGALSDFKIAGRTIFDLLDYLTRNIGMPLSEMGFALVAGWIAWRVVEHQLQTAEPLSPALLKVIRFGIAILSPLLIVVVVATGI